MNPEENKNLPVETGFIGHEEDSKGNLKLRYRIPLTDEKIEDTLAKGDKVIEWHKKNYTRENHDTPAASKWNLPKSPFKHPQPLIKGPFIRIKKEANEPKPNNN